MSSLGIIIRACDSSDVIWSSLIRYRVSYRLKIDFMVSVMVEFVTVVAETSIFASFVSAFIFTIFPLCLPSFIHLASMFSRGGNEGIAIVTS